MASRDSRSLRCAASVWTAVLGLTAIGRGPSATAAAPGVPPMAFPFPYRGWDSFPASFFGADPYGLENDTELALIAKHQLSGWGWQQGCMESCCPKNSSCDCGTSNPVGCPSVPPADFTPAGGHENEEGAVHAQALAFDRYLAAHNTTGTATQGIFAYRQLTNAAWWWRKNYAAYTNPATRGFFLTSDRTGEYCWSSGPLWDFRNASARRYYLDAVIAEVTQNETDALNMIFFDGGLGILAANPHASPSGAIGSSNCSIAIVTNASSPGGRDINVTDADRVESVMAYITLLKEIGLALNAHGIVPIYSLEVPFDPKVAMSRGFPGFESRGHVVTEAEVADALAGVTWMRYYEWFQSSGWSEGIGMSIENVMNETAHGIPVITHAYATPNGCADPRDVAIGSAVAAFLVAMGPYCYFQTSSSIKGGDPWTDSGWCWHPLFDLKCGEPKATATQAEDGTWARDFVRCSVAINQHSNRFNITHDGVLVASSDGNSTA